MPGLADIIGLGAEGAVNPNFGAQLHQQKFEASQQLQRLQHMHRQELAQNAQQNAEYYGGVGSPTGRQLHTLSQELLSYPNDATLESNLAKAQARYSQLVAAGDKELAQSHDGNRPIAPVGAAPAPPNAMNSSPFSPFIGQGAKEAFPIGGAPPAAQPATNPLTSPASGTNGGPASGQAGFPGPTASGPAPAPSVPAIPAVGSDAGIPAAPVAPVAGPAPALPNFQGDIDEFNQTGYMSPAIRAMIPGNAALSLGKQKLQAIQPILSELSGVMDENGTPDISKLLHTEAELSAMGVAPGGIAPMLGMLGPQNEVGLIPYGQLSQEDQAFYERTHPGVAPPGPLDPVRKVVHKYSRQTMSIEPQSQTLNFGKYGPNGEVIPIQGRSGEALPPVEGANGGPAPISSQFVPIVRNGIHYQWVDFGDHKELLPMPTSNTSQRGAGAPRAAGGGSLAPVAPATKTATPPTSGTPPAAPAPSSGNYRMKGLNPSKALDMKNAIEVGAHQLWGDPDNPALRPLASYAKLADDPAARDRIGAALKLVLDNGGADAASHVGATIGPVSVSAGGVGEWFTNQLGVPQKVAQQRAQILRDATAKLTPEELQYFNSLMNAIPTITGLRRLTGSGAFRWSQQGLERELPMIGLAGTNSAEAFRQKMIALGDEPLTAIKNIERTNPGAIDPRIVQMIRGGGGSAPTSAIQAVPGAPPPVAHWGRDAHGNPVRLQ